MALDVKVGSFEVDESVETQAITGVGFEPKIVFFYSVGATIEPGDSQRFGRFLYGVSDGTTHRAMANNSGRGFTGGVPFTNTRSLAVNHAYVDISGGPSGARVAFDIQSMDADGFTLFYQMQADSSADIQTVYYSALGGDDLTDIFIGSFDGDLASPRQFITDVGFKPDFINVFGIAHTESLDLNSTGIPGMQYTFGLATNRNQYVSAAKALNQQSTSNVRSSFREEIVSVFDDNVTSIATTGSLVTFDADGFTIDWLKQSDAYHYFFVALGGPRFKLGIEDTPSDPTKQAVPGIGFRPKLLWTMANGTVPSLPAQPAAAAFSFATADGTSNFAISYADPNGRVPETANRAVDTLAVVVKTENDIPRAYATLYEFGPQDFTLDWEIADPPRLQYCYLVMGDAANGTGTTTQVGNVYILDDVGAEVSGDISIATLIWTNIAAENHRLILGESDTSGDPANTVIEISAGATRQTEEIRFGGARFLRGVQITQLDSGKVYIYRGAPTNISVIALLATAGDATLVAAPGAGNAIYVVAVQATGADGGNNLTGLREGTGGTFFWRAFVNSTGTSVPSLVFSPYYKLPTNTALVANIAENTPDIYVTVQYHIAPG